MPDKQERIILDDDVFVLSRNGQNEIKGSATSLSPAALEVLVLIDGISTAAETVARAQSVGVQDAARILGELLQGGLIELPPDDAGSLDFVDFFQTKGEVKPSVAATVKAKKETAATTTLLQQQGYFVRIVRRAGARKQADENRVYSVLVVEDEPHLATLLKHVLTNEGFQVRNAKDRDEILAQLRQPPRPDLVLLDVTLPDVDGFTVLLKMRQHPGLKTTPVIMLTAKATRGAVIEGLASGADGYITKPFEIDVLVKAVNVVLGLSAGDQPLTDQDPWSA